MNMTATATYRVLIVDDHPIVRRGITQLIEAEPDLETCGEADDVAGGSALARELEPDIVLVDITLRRCNGLDLVAELSTLENPIPCLVVSMHDEDVYAERALRAGARGYVMKQNGDEVVIEAIRKVLAGQVYASDGFNQRLLRGLISGSVEDDTIELESLSEREIQVFQAMGQGKSTRVIAEEMDVNVKTIESFRRRIKAKLGIQNTNQLAYRAVEWSVRQGANDE